MCPTSLTAQVEFFLHYHVNTTHEDVNNFTSCEKIIHDLIPVSYFPFVLSKGYPSEVFKKMDASVKDYIKAFMEKRWKEDTQGENIFRTPAAKSADVFLMVEFCSHLFNIDFNFDKKLREFESALSKKQNLDNKQRKYSYLALMTCYEVSRSKSGSRWIVESLARTFYDSYFHLTKSASDPLEALIKFTKFVALISKKAEEVLPDSKLFLMWLEFYTTLSFFLIAKINKEMKRNYSELPHGSFFVPASYLHLMDFIEATFPKPAVLVQKAVNNIIPIRNSHDLIQDSLDNIVIMVCGTSKSTSLINVLFSADLGNCFSCAMAERALVLAMTLVSNVGTFVSVKSETALMQALTQLQPPEKCPKRLSLALDYVQKAQCIRDVGIALRDLLKKREEESLMCCKWIPISFQEDQRDHAQTSPLTNDRLLPANFLGENTMTAISRGVGFVPKLLELFVDREEETQMSKEEEMKWQIDAEAREKAETEKEAGMKILRLFRRFAFAARCHDLKARVEKQMVKEELEEKMIIFETAKVTDVMCGICNVSFEWLLEQSITQKDMVSDSFTIGKTNADNAYRSDFHGKIGEINADNNAANGKRNVAELLRSFSSESTPESGEMKGSTEEELKEMNARELMKIKEEHIQSKEHLQRQLEFHSFKKLFRDKIEPKSKYMQDYILKYELDNRHIRSTVYSNMQLEINRILFCMTKMNHEMNRIFHDRSWKTTQGLQQLLEDLFGAYNAVQNYIEESYKTFEQSQECQVAIASQVKVPVFKLRTQVFRSKRRGKKS